MSRRRNGIYVLSDDTGANEGNFLAVRPNHGTNQLDVLANNGGTLKIESYDAQATLSADTWYTIRACVENDSLSLYISDDTTEYTVAEDITAVGGIAISDIRKYAFTAGLRPYGTTCMYDNFTIGVPGLAGMYELSDPLEADASAEIIDDDGASGGSYVKVSGEENNTASFEIAPPGEGEYHVYIGYKTSPEYSKASFKLVRGGFPTIELGEVDMNSETEEFKEIQLADASFAGTDTMQLVMTLGGAAAAIDYIRVAEIPEDLFSANTGRYVIREDLPQQTIWGLGVEIQSDSIASGNQGIDNDNNEGKLYEAQQVADKDWLKTASYGTTTNFGSYQNFGNVSVTLNGSGNTENYKRELDLNNAVSTVTYDMDGASYKRTYFASYPEKIVAMRYECDKENAYDASITFDKGHTGDVIEAVSDDELTMSGSLDNLDYEAKLKVIAEDGTVSADGSSIKVSGATSFVILLTAGTDYLASSPTYRGKDYKADNARIISTCSEKSFEELMDEHIADYTSVFGKNTLSLNDERSDVPTDVRVKEYKSGTKDTGLEAMLYQYGRYMLVSSSREGTLPANLQGVWNNSNDPEWGSMFCYNINLNMNYWCAENTNLSECHVPLVEFIDSLRESGRESAKAYFGCDGWLTSKKSDIWGFTMPYGESVYGLSVGGSGWLCEDVWEYYNFNRDEDYLRDKAYPIMREAAEFYLDYLTENDEGYLVASPSSSPENSFMYNGKKVNICGGTEYDHRIIQELFENCIKAAEILGDDDEFKGRIQEALSKLAPSKIGSNGELLEWDAEYTKAEKNHRHLSFIYGIHPAQVYDTREDTEIAEAAKKTLLSRGSNSTAWSTAWRIPIWARYFDGENAYNNVKTFLKTNVNENLFCVKPFQVDGNLGFTAGIAEMILQSNYDKEIILLPAIPDAWDEGYVTGLRARGDFTVDIQWGGGKLLDAVIYGDAGNSGTVEYDGNVIEFTIPESGKCVLSGESF